MSTTRAVPLLLVQADLRCATKIKRALRELGAADGLVHVPSAAAALTYLSTRPTDRPLVALVDMDLPDMKGLDLLHEMKRDETWKSIPVVLLTTSDKSLDILKSFDYSIAGYLVKPCDNAPMMEAIQAVIDYWSLSQMPPCCAAIF